MILEQTEINVEKSSNFEQTEFRIDEKYKNKVLWMMINQYRHKVRTPVQEIISNGRDAQRENGNPDKPLKIQLPTKLEPTFIVRDFGVGMDEERIKTIFTSFGASTKNADNSQTGGFGIGAKSPLAYTDSFNIKTYVDGQYWFYVIAKTKNEGIGINLLGTGKTEEENGTEVQIPVKKYDTQDFIDAAIRCTMFWDVLPEFNLLEQDLYRATGGTKISDELTVYKQNDLGRLFDNVLCVVVDGIPYELDYKTTKDIKEMDDIKYLINSNSTAFFKLNTGDIDLLQTRESIEDTKKTHEKLSNLASKGLSDIEAYVTSFITEKSLEGVFKQYQDVASKFRKINAYKFEVFTILAGQFYIDKDLSTFEYDYKSKSNSYYSRSSKLSTPQRSHDMFAFDGDDLGNFYYDDLKDSESQTMKDRRMRYELTENDTSAILLKQGNASNLVYMRTLRMLGAKKLSSLAKPPKKAVVRNAQGKRVAAKKDEVSFYNMLGSNYHNNYYSSRKGGIKHKIKLDDVENTYAYLEYTEEMECRGSAYLVHFLKEHYNTIVVKMTKTDIKIIKDDKNFVPFKEFMRELKPTKDMVNSVISNHINSTIKGYDFSKIADKRIANKVLTKMVQCVNIKIEIYADKIPRALRDQITEENKSKIEAKITIAEMLQRKIETKYPLLDKLTNRGEIINYINSKEK